MVALEGPAHRARYRLRRINTFPYEAAIEINDRRSVSFSRNFVPVFNDENRQVAALYRQ